MGAVRPTLSPPPNVLASLCMAESTDTVDQSTRVNQFDEKGMCVFGRDMKERPTE